jgi:hypothetical protein
MRRKTPTRSRERAVITYNLTLPIATYQRAKRAARTLDLSTRAYLHALLMRAIPQPSHEDLSR